MRKININDIRIDGGTQGRVLINQTKVGEYAENMRDGDVFPRMMTVYDGTTYWLVDGFHRYHAYKTVGVDQVEIDYKPGTLEEAQVMSFGMNARHGLPRTNEDKRKVVQEALEHPLLKDKSDYEIAKVCVVSKTFVAAVRDPKAKERQKANIEKHFEKKRGLTTSSLTTNGKPEDGSLDPVKKAAQSGEAPDDAELRANELQLEADTEIMYKLLDADDKLAEAWDEIKRLNHLNAQLEVRMNELVTEKNEAIKEVKKLQKQLDKLRKQQ